MGCTYDYVVSSFVFYLFRYWEPLELLSAVLMAWCSENKACSSILYFQHRLTNRAGGAHEKRTAIV